MENICYNIHCRTIFCFIINNANPQVDLSFKIVSFPQNLVQCFYLFAESLQAEMVHQGAIPIFFNSLKSFINKDSDMAELVIDALAAFATSGLFLISYLI